MLRRLLSFKMPISKLFCLNVGFTSLPNFYCGSSMTTTICKLRTYILMISFETSNVSLSELDLIE